MQSAEQAWIASSGTEQNPSFHSTGDAAPTPEEPASRGALNPFLNKTKQNKTVVSGVTFPVLLFSLTVSLEAKI